MTRARVAAGTQVIFRGVLERDLRKAMPEALRYLPLALVACAGCGTADDRNSVGREASLVGVVGMPSGFFSLNA